MGSIMSTQGTPANTEAAAANDTADRIKLPGFGLPRNVGWHREDKHFPHALEKEGRGKLSKGVFLRERRMIEFINSITDKPEWERKVFDEEIVAKWRAEAKAMEPVEEDDVFMSDPMFDYCVLELRDKAERLKKTGYVTALDAEVTIVKADNTVSDELVADLKKCVAKLEDVPDHQKDWHPGSDNQVLDLLHPSLFPVIFGVTRALPTGTVPLDDAIAYTGLGELTKDERLESTNRLVYGIAQHQDLYQWLPSEVKLAQDGTASITSYINNLHPRDHKELYGVLEKFVAASVPLWEEVLTSWGDLRRYKFTGTNDEEDYYIPEGLVYERPPPDPEDLEDPDYEEEDPDDYLYTEEYQNWVEEHRILKFPEPDEFVSFDKKTKSAERVHLTPTGDDAPLQFPDGLQVIFKLANIHLTPEKPSYAGGSWHIEGTLSERICATALYYYDEENITPSRLAFRQGIDEEEAIMYPMQNAYSSLESYLGVQQDGPAIQDLGSVLTRPGRLLAFPNVLQHRVGSFELEDKTKPGHRKILAMFLIDPHRRILSSANVPPQRKDWWSERVHDTPALNRLPNELFTQVIDMVDSFPLSWESAVAIRADLMKERSNFTEQLEGEFEEHTFSFCEH